MKTLKLIALVALAFTFSRCKTSSPTQATQGPAPSVQEILNVLDSTEIMFLQFAEQTKGNAMDAIMLTNEWLLSQQNISSAIETDSTYIDITLKSGLKATFYFNPVDDNGYSLFRGGGNPSSKNNATLSGSETLSKNKIDNKKILLFASDTKTLLSVEPQLQNTLKHFTNSGLGLEVTVLRNEQCTYNVVEHFGDYGLVIIDTHGTPQSFMLGTQLDFTIVRKNEADLKTYITTQAGAGAYEKIVSGDLILAVAPDINTKIPNWWKSIKYRTELFCAAQYLDKLPSMPKTVVFGNMCYSGFAVSFDGHKTYDHPIRTAFINRNLISYYGYVTDWRAPGNSRPVPDVFAAQMEDGFVQRLISNTDSTKIANLQTDNKTEFFDPEHYDPSYGALRGDLSFRHFGADDYSYDKPCVSSFTDARDGHVYKAVCIGKQNWMAENLDYQIPGSECYDSLPANCTTYGKLYRRSQVMNGASSSNANPSGVQGICPKGWHVPSAAEWDQLITFLGGTDKAGGAMKAVSTLWTSPNAGATNSSGFSALPGGEWADANAAASARFFYNKNFYGMFHTCSEIHPNQIDMIQLEYNTAKALWWTYPATIPPVYAGNNACRCLKD